MKTDPDSGIAPCLDTPEFRSTGGLTKREYFAAMLMQGLNANPELSEIHESLSSRRVSENLASIAVVGADDLIAELNK